MELRSRRVRLLAPCLSSVALLWLLGCGGAAQVGVVEPGLVEAPAHPGRGVILFVGDGMGIASITAARIHKGASDGMSPPSAAVLRIETAPRSCLVRTASRDSMVTDSAAAMTALVTGVRVPNGYLSADLDAAGAPQPLRTLVEEAEARGLSTGIVTTTTLTHATPAALYAHIENRRSEEEIATALLPASGNPALGDGVEILLGGGRAFFVPADEGGVRADDRDLVAELRAAGYASVRNATELRDAVAAGGDKILGLFTDAHMAFEADRVASASEEPSLAEMTARAIEVLRRNPRGYFLMVEGGRIDHAHHMNNARRAIVDVLAFDAAVAAALEATTAEDAIFVTADHDHTMVIAGYPIGDRDVFTQVGVDRAGQPYSAIQYANGPAALMTAARHAAQDIESLDYRERAGVPLDAETHGAQDVPLYVFGPSEVYADLPAAIDNTDVFKFVRSALSSGE